MAPAPAPESIKQLPAASTQEKPTVKQRAVSAKTITGKDGAPKVLIPAGKFWMGSPDGVGEKDEHPRHQVTLDAFYMDKFEVTVSKYAEFMRAKSRNEPSIGIRWIAISIGIFRSSGWIGMMQIPIADGLGSDYPQRRSGRRLRAVRMGERTRGGMTNRQRSLQTSGKSGFRPTSMTNASPQSIVTKRAPARMDFTIWLTTCGNGWRIGMTKPITARARSVIQRGLLAASYACSAVGPGSMNR